MQWIGLMVQCGCGLDLLSARRVISSGLSFRRLKRSWPSCGKGIGRLMAMPGCMAVLGRSVLVGGVGYACWWLVDELGMDMVGDGE